MHPFKHRALCHRALTSTLVRCTARCTMTRDPPCGSVRGTMVPPCSRTMLRSPYCIREAPLMARPRSDSQSSHEQAQKCIPGVIFYPGLFEIVLFIVLRHFARRGSYRLPKHIRDRPDTSWHASSLVKTQQSSSGSKMNAARHSFFY